VVIAEKLGELTNYVGGAEHVHRLLPPLEVLAAVEESLVREATIKSAEQVAAAMPIDHIVKFYCPFVTSLASKDWYTARITATNLFHSCYPRLAERSDSAAAAAQFRQLFITLCADETSMVRRSGAINLSKHFVSGEKINWIILKIKN
jgi:serine/threonine-protein phosphatase 2A regulatory subunit A